jgi:pyridoxamine 5'-phosphate oxidase
MSGRVAVGSQPDASPLELLERWLEEAREAGEPSPEEMTLATVSADGAPSLRTVSLKEIDERGLVFTTTLYSLKAVELTANPRVALLLRWKGPRRQARVLGGAEVLGRAVSERLFARRERSHQLQTMVSRQGAPIEDLEATRAALRAAEERFRDDEPRCPEDWGAVRVEPTLVEFWEERADRLHERIEHRRDRGGPWNQRRLGP